MKALITTSLLLLLCSALSSSLLLAAADEGSNEAATATTVDKETASQIHKMRVKQLKEELAERGLECTGCLEKDSYVDMLLANRHLPKGQQKPKVEAEGGKKIPDSVDWRDKVNQAELDDMISRIKGSKNKEELKDMLEKLQKQSGIKLDVNNAGQEASAAQAEGEDSNDEL